MPQVIEAVSSGVSSTLNAPEEVELAELLVSMHPWADKVGANAKSLLLSVTLVCEAEIGTHSQPLFCCYCSHKINIGTKRVRYFVGVCE